MIKRSIVVILLLSGWGFAEQVQITSPLPLPIAGTFTANASTATVNVVSTYTLVTDTYSLPVAITGSISNTGFNVNNPPVTYTVTPGSGTFPVSGTFFQANQPVYVTNPTTASITGTVQSYVNNPTTTTVSNFPNTYTVTPGSGTFGVSGTFFQATQPVSWAGAQPITVTSSSTLTVTPGTGTFPVSGTFFQATQPIYIVNPTTTSFSTAQNVVSTSIVVTSTSPLNTNVINTGFNVNNSPSVFLATTSVSINGSSNTVQLTGTLPAFSVTPAVYLSTVSAYISGSSNTVQLTGNLPSFSATPSVFLATTSVSINGSSNTIQAQQVIGTRWNVSFSTLSTTAVLSSTSSATSLAISTPIAAVASQTIRIFRLTLSVDAATNINFRDSGTQFGETFYLGANGSITLDLSNEPWYITSSGNAFVIQQSGTANIGSRIFYTQS